MPPKAPGGVRQRASAKTRPPPSASTAPPASRSPAPSPHHPHPLLPADPRHSPPPQPRTRPPQATVHVAPLAAFYVLLAAHTLAALAHPIQDCDEVFNYWEPTHYLLHGYGFQTWEYSPDFAIRSWAYTALHALVVAPLKLFARSKAAQFYFLRIVLGFVCALCETRLFAKVHATLHPRIAALLLFVLATAPGMAHASTAYLPSSFAMYFSTLGAAAFMDWRGGLRTAQGIWMFGVGACLGWPFAAALSIPFLLEEVFLASLTDAAGMVALLWRVVDGVVRTALILACQVGLDWFFYKKLVLVPLNIVLYNVFTSHGPDLYGTEPWPFYFRNLFLNFHVFFLLALLALPLLIVQTLFRAQAATGKTSYLRGLVFLSPFYLWLAIFTLQPHKEERFMYPAYPFLALNAAVSLHVLLSTLGSADPKALLSRIPVQIRLFAILAFFAGTLVLSFLRTLGTMTAYAAPLSIYQPLHSQNLSDHTNVCLGKEWYRFPSHFLLPPTARGKFIRSAFTGLLPGEFSPIPSAQGFGLFPGTWMVPPGMNDENREDVGKYTEVRRCDFLVDSAMDGQTGTEREPRYVDDEAGWERVRCQRFLDAGSTGTVGRLVWVPDWAPVPQRWKRKWGEYCLLKRKEVKRRQVKIGDAAPPRIEHFS